MLAMPSAQRKNWKLITSKGRKESDPSTPVYQLLAALSVLTIRARSGAPSETQIETISASSSLIAGRKKTRAQAQEMQLQKSAPRMKKPDNSGRKYLPGRLPDPSTSTVSRSTSI